MILVLDLIVIFYFDSLIMVLHFRTNWVGVGVDASENTTSGDPDLQPPSTTPPKVPLEPQKAKVVTIQEGETSVPGWMIASLALQGVTLVGALVLTVTGVVLYVGYKTRANEIKPYSWCINENASAEVCLNWCLSILSIPLQIFLKH